MDVLKQVSLYTAQATVATANIQYLIPGVLKYEGYGFPQQSRKQKLRLFLNMKI